MTRRWRGPNRLALLILAIVAGVTGALAACGAPTPTAPTATLAPTPAAPAATPTFRPAVPPNSVSTPLPTLPPEPGERVFADSELVQVFASSGLGVAMQEVVQSYLTANPTSARVQLTFGTPPRLVDQIRAGNPADVLAWNDPSADTAIRQSGVLDGEPRVLTRGRLVLVVPHGNPKQVVSLKDLASPGRRWVGARADTLLGASIARLLDNAARQPDYDTSFRQTAERNIQLRAEDPDEVLERVADGADAGIVHAEDVPLDARQLVDVISVPDDVNLFDDYSIGVVKQGPNPTGAQTFVQFVTSPTAQAIFVKYGYVEVHT